MICPLCSAPLQRLEGHDGFRVYMAIDNTLSAIVEVPAIAVIRACPKCEFVKESTERPRLDISRPSRMRVQR